MPDESSNFTGVIKLIRFYITYSYGGLKGTNTPLTLTKLRMSPSWVEDEMKPTSQGLIKDVVEASKVVEKKSFYHGILTNIYKMKCLEMELVFMKGLFLISPR